MGTTASGAGLEYQGRRKSLLTPQPISTKHQNYSNTQNPSMDPTTLEELQKEFTGEAKTSRTNNITAGAES